MTCSTASRRGAGELVTEAVDVARELGATTVEAEHLLLAAVRRDDAAATVAARRTASTTTGSTPRSRPRPSAAWPPSA